MGKETGKQVPGNKPESKINGSYRNPERMDKKHRLMCRWVSNAAGKFKGVVEEKIEKASLNKGGVEMKVK